MRSLKKNMTRIWYSVKGSQIETDEWGNETRGYGKPIALNVSLSASSGRVGYEPFGHDLNYEKTMSTTLDLPIDEDTRIWIDKPITDTNDWVVVAKARGLTNHLYALKRVEKHG